MFALGDQTNVYEYAEPQASFGDRWKDELDDPQLWRWVVNTSISSERKPWPLWGTR